MSNALDDARQCIQDYNKSAPTHWTTAAVVKLLERVVDDCAARELRAYQAGILSITGSVVSELEATTFATDLRGKK